MNKVAVVTGCGEGGIGHQLTLQLLERGITVIATLLPFEKHEHLHNVAGVHVVDLDVTSEEQVKSFTSTCDKICNGRLDFLFNNAGIIYTMPAVDTDVKQAEKMFAVNVFGPMRMVHHLHKLLINAKGAVVNTGSIGGVCPFVYGASYNASKAALHHWGNTLRVEMKPFGVRVINIISGEVSTAILKQDANRTLPSDSAFKPIEDLFQAHITRNPPGRTSPAVYAASVVGQVTKPNPAVWFWTGSHASLFRFIDSFLPRTFYDWWFTSMFGLGKLAKGR